MGENDNNSLFGVFDGHGGSEVSSWVASHLKDELAGTQEYKDKDWKGAFEQAFKSLDT